MWVRPATCGPLVLLASCLGVAMAGLDPAAPDYCTWLAAAENVTDPTACLDQCYEICRNNPGEYVCIGSTVHTDTEEDRLDPDSVTL